MDLKELQQLGKEIGFFKIEEMEYREGSNCFRRCARCAAQINATCMDETGAVHLHAELWKSAEKIFQVIQEASSFRQKASWKMNLTEKA